MNRMKTTFSVFIILFALGCAEQEVPDPYHGIDGKWSVVYYNESPMVGEIMQFEPGEIVFQMSSGSVSVSIEDHVEMDRIEEGNYKISFDDGPCDYEAFKSIFFDDQRLGTLSIYGRDSIVISEGCVDGLIIGLVR